MKFKPLLRILLIVSGLVALLLVMGALLFLYLLRDTHFKETIKRQIETSLSEENFEVHMDDLAYHPFHGLSAENVVINSVEEGKRPIANIKRLSFSLNIFGLLPGHSFVKKVHLYNAAVNIPLSDDPNQFLPLWIAHGKVILKANFLEILDTKFTFENIEFSVRGSLINLRVLKSPANTSQKTDYSQKLNRLIEELKKIKYLKKPPQVDLVFEGDLSIPEVFRVLNISIHAEDCEYEDISVQELVLDGSYVQGNLEIHQLHLEIPKGELTAWATVDLNNSKGHLNLNNTINPLPFLSHFLSPQKFQTLENLKVTYAPEIHVDTDFSWENGKLRYNGSGRAKLHSFSYKNVPFSSLELKLSSKNEIVKLEKLSLEDAKGKLTASGSTNLNTSLSHYTIHSSLDLPTILKEFVSDSQRVYLDPLRTESPPIVDLTADLSWNNQKWEYQGTGSVALSSFSYNRQFFSQLNAKFSAADGAIELQEVRLQDPKGDCIASGKLVHENNVSTLQNFHLQTPSGTLQVNGYLAPEKFQIDIDSTVNPKDFIAFFPPKVQDFFNEAEIRDSPRIILHLNGSPHDLDSFSGHGEFDLGRTAVRKAWVDFARTKFEVNNQALICHNFSIGHNEQRASGTLIYDYKQKAVRLNNVVSTLIPEEIMRWIDPSLSKILSHYRFTTPPHVKADGIVHLKNQELNNLFIQLNSDGVDYDLLKRTLHFDQISGQIHIEGPWVKVHLPAANIFQGSVAFSANISINSKNPIMKIDITFAHLDLATLTKLYFNYDSSKGFLSGNFGFQAHIGQETDMVGNGNLRVEDGTVLSVPFLGPISFILNKIMPGSGNATAKDAVASFQVANRKVTTKDLQITGSRFTLLGYGDIEFLTGKMDMTMRINAQGLPGVLFFPISKLLEYESKGTITNPEWHVK